MPPLFLYQDYNFNDNVVIIVTKRFREILEIFHHFEFDGTDKFHRLIYTIPRLSFHGLTLPRHPRNSIDVACTDYANKSTPHREEGVSYLWPFFTPTLPSHSPSHRRQAWRTHTHGAPRSKERGWESRTPIYRRTQHRWESKSLPTFNDLWPWQDAPPIRVSTLVLNLFFLLSLPSPLREDVAKIFSGLDLNLFPRPP